jgi:regulatory protein
MPIDSLLFEKLTAFCAYQERCKKDVVQKMRKLEIVPEDQAEYIERLIEENFLNEHRFVRSYVNAHIKKHWGKNKIKAGLYNKQIKSDLIKEYLNSVENENYEQKINDVVALKWPKIKGETLHQRKAKLIQHLMGKGYEYDKFKLVVNALKV